MSNLGWCLAQNRHLTEISYKVNGQINECVVKKKAVPSLEVGNAVGEGA